MQIDVVNNNNEKVGAFDVRDEVFGGRVNTDLIWESVVLKAPATVPPSVKTITTITAAMPATSRPYSTAEAPRSSILARRAFSMMRR